MPSETAILNRLIKNMRNRERDPLRPLIDKYLIERDRPGANRYPAFHIDMTPRPRPGGRISPSSVGGCEREAVLRFLGVRGRRRIDPDSQLIFDDGHWRHHKWQYTFHDMEAVLGKDVFEVIGIEEKAAIPALFTSGSLDAIVRIRGVLWVIDFKGANDAMFNRVNREDAPLPKHVMQLLLYCKAKKVRRGIVFYENKNNQLTKSFAVNFDAEEWVETKRWIGSVLRYLGNRRIPPKHANCSAGNFQYERCQFSKLCYGDLDAKGLARVAYKGKGTLEQMWEAGNAEAES